VSEQDRSHVLEALRQRANRHFASTGHPFVTLSYAQSLDGSIAGVRGRPLAISGPESLMHTHALRGCHDAILVGIGTVLSDDPALTTRLVDGPDPCPIVLDSRLRIPLSAQVLACDEAMQPIVVTTAACDTGRQHALEKRGVRILTVSAGARGWVDLEALMPVLGGLGIRRLMVEGGARIMTSFLQARCVQHLVVTLSMQLVGGLPALKVLPAEEGLEARLAPSFRQWMGDDLVLHGDPVWHSRGGGR
jgi:3,4-dihydroxy 2-butanone 4-phosphate synthase/GTP cyclohydrolase II